MWRIFVPLNYLRIRYIGWGTFIVTIPVLFCLLNCIPLFLPEFFWKVVFKFSIIEQSSNILSILTGFFVAALAAVSTFGNPDMDKPMHGPVTLGSTKLTRRRFLSYLFGFLSFLSIWLYIVGYALHTIQNFIIIPMCFNWASVTSVVIWFFYSFLVGQLLSGTLLGLFYLTDRIHRPDREINTNNDSSKE